LKVAVVADMRQFQHSPDGSVWTRSSHAYAFWVRYLDAFDHVCVLARSRQVDEPLPAAQRADGEGVSFSPVADYRVQALL